MMHALDFDLSNAHVKSGLGQAVMKQDALWTQMITGKVL